MRRFAVNPRHASRGRREGAGATRPSGDATPQRRRAVSPDRGASPMFRGDRAIGTPVDFSDFDPRLLRLTYASRAVEGLTRADLHAIAAEAQRRNRKLGITGLLLYVDSDFLQVLEGPGAAVERLYEMIEKDPRNKWVTRLSTERILRRAFEDWSMGCFEVGLDEMDEELFFVIDGDAPKVRPRFNGDFTVFLEQFYERNRARGKLPDFARAV